MKEKTPISFIVLSICIAGFIYRFDFYNLSVSTPTIANYFKISTETVSLLYIIYLVIVSGGLLIAGRLGDRVGLKRAFLIGFLIYLSGSILAAISYSETVLIICRGIQGIGMSFILTSAYGTVSYNFSPGKRVAIFGLYSMSAQIGVSLGCPVGGVLTEWFSWRGIFIMDALFGGLGFVAVLLGKSPKVDQEPVKEIDSIDYLGCVLWFLSIGLFLFTLNKGHSLGWWSAEFWGLIILSLIFGLGFVLWEIRCNNPLLPISLLGGMKGMISFSVGMFCFGLIAGNSFLLPFFLKNIKLMSNSQIGWLFLIYSVTAAVISIEAKKLSSYIAPRKVITLSIFIVMLGCIIFFTGMQNRDLWPVITLLLLLGIGFGFYFPNNNNVVMSSAPEGKRGTYAGIFNTFNNMGMAIGVCLFEVVFSFKADHAGQIKYKVGSDSSWMLPGFRNAYFLAIIFSLMALALSALIMWRWSSISKKKAD